MIDDDKLTNKLLWLLELDLFKPRDDFLGEYYVWCQLV